MGEPEPSAEAVRRYLENHPQVLENYLMEEVELEQLERWMIRRTQRAKKVQSCRKTSLSRWKVPRHLVPSETNIIPYESLSIHLLFIQTSSLINTTQFPSGARFVAH